MDKRAAPATLKDVAAKAGLSLITVSRALRHPDSVREKTRLRVQEAIRTVGYVPNLTARSLVSSRSNVIGLVVPFLRSSLFADLAESLAHEASKNGRQLLLGVSNRSPEEEEGAVRTFVGRQVDAIVVTGFTHSADCRSMLCSFPGPVIETWNLQQDPVDLAVGFDNHAAARDMTEYLIGRGYRHIALVGGEFSNNDQAKDRFNGFRDCMARAGRSIRPEHVIEIPNPTTIASGRAALLRLLSTIPRPDAIFFHAELPAHGAVMACLTQGISIPDEIAIAGFGDLTLSALLPVPLTTIRIKAEEIGMQAGQLIHERLDETRESGRLIDVGYDLIRRQSA